MKITKSRLKKIIKEELQHVLKEAVGRDPRFLARSKEMGVRSVGSRVDDPATLSPDELRAMADELEQEASSIGLDELASYTCFQLEEVMRQHEEGDRDLDRETLVGMRDLMRKKGCRNISGQLDWGND
jgi:arsenate reductase-like glutaredoxin family protein